MSRVIKKTKIVYNWLLKKWSVVQLFPHYIIVCIKQMLRFLPETDKKIILIFDDDNMFGTTHNNGREAYYVLKSFSDGGYNVYFYHHSDFKSYYRLREFGRLIYGIKNLKFISGIPENTQNYIYGFDSINSDFLKLRWKKLVYVNIRKASTYQIGNFIPMPFFMLPLVNLSDVDDYLKKYRYLKRKFRIFFGGHMSATYYNSPLFKQRYPQYMTRLDGLNSVFESDVDFLFLRKAKEIKKYITGRDYLKKFVIVQTDYPFPIKPSNWLKILGLSDFFVCFSGTDYPMCHNAIEAMSVGSIPILAYSDWFDPALEHGKNAIIYSGKEDLIEKIKDVLKMPNEQIMKLRKNVIEYYDNYLASGCLARKYEKNAQDVSTLMLFPQWGAFASEESAGREFVNKFKMVMQKYQCQDQCQNVLPFISVIIPTFNRAKYLEGAILSLAKQDYPKDRFEIIVVDNNSNDETINVMRLLIEKFTGRLNLCYCFEERKGIVFGRHTGAFHSHGSIILFTDDDAVFDGNWLSVIADVYFSHPDVGAVGTLIRIKWDKAPKRWVYEYEGLLGRLDWPRELIIRRGLEIFGGSFSIRKNYLFETGGFNPGQIDSYLVGDCEIGLCRKLDFAGIPVALTPKTTMWHLQEADRNGTVRDIRRRFVNCGISDAYYATFYHWSAGRVIKDVVLKGIDVSKRFFRVCNSFSLSKIVRFIIIDMEQYRIYLKYLIIYRLKKGRIHQILARKDWEFNENYQAQSIQYFSNFDVKSGGGNDEENYKKNKE
ncbi:MAG: glycosyltransferase [Nanoarchaeota archaeon]